LFFPLRKQRSQGEGKFQKMLDVRSERDIARVGDGSSSREVAEKSRISHVR